MRPINADALKGKMCEGCDNKHLCKDSPACETVQQIDAMPTIEAITAEEYTKIINDMVHEFKDYEPVKHGRWIRKESKRYYWFECSEYGYPPPLDKFKREWFSDYCPNCGSEMDPPEEPEP